MSDLPPPTSAPAGWYQDPDGPGPRYFDGRAWAPPSTGFERRDEHPDLPAVVAVGALLVLTVSLVVSKLMLDAIAERGWPLVVLVGLSALIAYGPALAWGVYVRRRWGTGRLATLGWRFRWSDLCWGPLTWLAAIAIQIAVVAIVLALGVPIASNAEGLVEVDSERAYIVATLITAVVAAPIVEELVFRGLVMRGLLRVVNPTTAIGLQAVLFGLAHVDPVRGWGNVGLAAVLSGVGLAFGGAAYLLRRLGPTVVAHAIFNGVVLTLILTGVADSVGGAL